MDPARRRPIVEPVLNTYPDSAEYYASGVPTSGDLVLTVSGSFSNDWSDFRARGSIHVTWANFVTGVVKAELVKALEGGRFDYRERAFTWERLMIPVAQGDTVIDVTISTGVRRCGLIGKSDISGSASARILTGSSLISVWTLQKSDYGADVSTPPCSCELEPDQRVRAPESTLRVGSPLAAEHTSANYSYCDGGDAPSPPQGYMGEDGQVVCYSVWYVEIEYNPWTYEIVGYSEPLLGQRCYLYGMMT